MCRSDCNLSLNEFPSNLIITIYLQLTLIVHVHTNIKIPSAVLNFFVNSRVESLHWKATMNATCHLTSLMIFKWSFIAPNMPVTISLLTILKRTFCKPHCKMASVKCLNGIKKFRIYDDFEVDNNKVHV